jgi:hypothetical protein
MGGGGSDGAWKADPAGRPLLPTTLVVMAPRGPSATVGPRPRSMDGGGCVLDAAVTPAGRRSKPGSRSPRIPETAAREGPRLLPPARAQCRRFLAIGGSLAGHARREDRRGGGGAAAGGPAKGTRGRRGDRAPGKLGSPGLLLCEPRPSGAGVRETDPRSALQPVRPATAGAPRSADVERTRGAAGGRPLAPPRGHRGDPRRPGDPRPIGASSLLRGAGAHLAPGAGVVPGDGSGSRPPRHRDGARWPSPGPGPAGDTRGPHRGSRGRSRARSPGAQRIAGTSDSMGPRAVGLVP